MKDTAILSKAIAAYIIVLLVTLAALIAAVDYFQQIAIPQQISDLLYGAFVISASMFGYHIGANGSINGNNGNGGGKSANPPTALPSDPLTGGSV